MEAGGRRRRADSQVDDTRLDDRVAVFLVDAQDAAHAIEVEDDAAGHRRRAAAEAGSRAPRHERDAPFRTPADTADDVVSTLAQDDELRDLLVQRESVALVGAALGGVLDQPVCGNPRTQFVKRRQHAGILT